jgi:hypothetical protein
MKKAPAPTKTQGASEIEQGGLFCPPEFSPNLPTHGISADSSLASSGGKFSPADESGRKHHRVAS